MTLQRCATGISRVYNILPSPDLYFAQRRSTPPPLLSIATHRAPTGGLVQVRGSGILWPYVATVPYGL
jgi:hypothetical protein